MPCQLPFTHKLLFNDNLIYMRKCQKVQNIEVLNCPPISPNKKYEPQMLGFIEIIQVEMSKHKAHIWPKLYNIDLLKGIEVTKKLPPSCHPEI